MIFIIFCQNPYFFYLLEFNNTFLRPNWFMHTLVIKLYWKLQIYPSALSILKKYIDSVLGLRAVIMQTQFKVFTCFQIGSANNSTRKQISERGKEKVFLSSCFLAFLEMKHQCGLISQQLHLILQILLVLPKAISFCLLRYIRTSWVMPSPLRSDSHIFGNLFSELLGSVKTQIISFDSPAQ